MRGGGPVVMKRWVSGVVVLAVLLLAGCSRSMAPATVTVRLDGDSARTVNEPKLVQSLYTSLLALPPVPPGVRHCPLDTGSTVQLVFLGDGTRLLEASARTTGCRDVTLSDGRVLATSGAEGDKFRSLLLQAASGSLCPYAGAVVEVAYQGAADLGRVRDLLAGLGWQQTNTGAHEVINGTLEGATVSALASGGRTLLSVHVLQSHDEADYPKEDQAAEALLRRVQAGVEAALGLHAADGLVHRVNRGCEG